MSSLTETKNGYTLTVSKDEAGEYLWVVKIDRNDEVIDLGCNVLFEESVADGQATLNAIAEESPK